MAFEKNVNRCHDKLSEQNFENCLATSCQHNYAMITDCRKFTPKWSLYGMSIFHFYYLNQFKIIQETNPNFLQRPMSDVG